MPGRLYPDTKNEYRLMPDGSVRITLTRGYFAYVDAEDVHLVAPYRWHVHITVQGITTAKHNVRRNSMHATMYMHQILMPDGIPDHIDCDALNNRRSNLRYVTRTQNQQNRRKLASASSPYKGVFVDKRRPGVWRAKIETEQGRVYLGSFSTEHDAARAYDAAARNHFGPFARLNFPEDGEQSAIV